MRIYYQPTEENPSDWRSCDSSEWGGLGEWTCHALLIQGLLFDGADHYAVEHLGNGDVRVTGWYDSADWPRGHRWAREVLIRPLGRDARPEYGGAINTRHEHTIYAEREARKLLRGVHSDIKPWGRFDPRRHGRPGTWVSDEKHEAHRDTRSTHGWREWTDGLHENYLKDGRVKDQRKMGRYLKPRGTRTYYHNVVAQPAGAHAALHENEMGLSPAGVVSEEAKNIGAGGDICWSAVCPAGEPNSASWPTTGVYRHQLDVTLVGSDLAFGVADCGGNTGHFCRVSSDLGSCLQSFEQDQGLFAGPGLHLASVTDPAWSSGSAADRFMVVIAAYRTIGHGNQNITQQLGEYDDFADGPWAAAVGPSDDGVGIILGSF